jgi:hypothetical protein
VRRVNEAWSPAQGFQSVSCRHAGSMPYAIDDERSAKELEIALQRDIQQSVVAESLLIDSYQTDGAMTPVAASRRFTS